MSRTSPILILLGALCLVVAPLAAQQAPPAAPQTSQDPRITQPSKPIPPASAAEDAVEAVPTQNVRPDSSPISGAQSFSLGIFGGRSYFAPSFRLSQLADSNNGGNTTTSTNWRGVTSLSGDFRLQHFANQNIYSLAYTVGGTFLYRNAPGPNTPASTSNSSQYHNFQASMQAAWRRWTFYLMDTVQFLPESAFGGSGIPGVVGGIGGGFGGGGFGGGGFGNGGFGGGFGGGLFGGGLQPGFTPGQGILTGQSKRVANTVLGQAQYDFNRRTAMTFTGSYGILRFPDGGFIESDSYRFQTGISHQVSSVSTIGVIYSAGLLRFSGSTRGADNHAVQLAYGRRITGRMALQLSGGPQFNRFDSPVTGSSTSVSASVRASLSYRFPMTSLALNYNRGFTGGSGLLQGASSDHFDFSLTRPLTRNWQFGAHAGYGFNKSIQQLNTLPTEQHFHTVVGGVFLSRQLLRKVSMRVNYDFQRQAGTLSACAPGTPNCGTTLLRHHFGLSLIWSPGPYELD